MGGSRALPLLTPHIIWGQNVLCQGDNGRCFGNLRQWLTHRMLSGSIEDRTSCCHWEFCVCCYVTCFYVVPVNIFSIRGCKDESCYSFLHNIMLIPMNLTSGTPLSKSSVPQQLRSDLKACQQVCFLLTI